MLEYPRRRLPARRLPGPGRRRHHEGLRAGLLAPWRGSPGNYRNRKAMVGIVCAASLITAYGGTAQASAATPRARLSITPAAAAEQSIVPVYLNTHYSFAERAADLVSRMTLAEKVAQLHTNSAPAIPRLGVQQYTYWSEGQHGINTLGANTNNGGVSGGVHATSFPTNFASTMTWDPALTYQETIAISDEARGFLDKSLWGTGQNNIGPDKSDYGSLTFWAPTVNMDRDPRWGRTDEAFGEDPYLVGQMAGAFVAGYQGETLSGQPQTPYLKVASTAKHYALNDNENNRHADSSNTTDANIRDYYTAQFRDLTENSHVSGLMTSYNAINGTPAPADTYTANELLQRTYGFNGYITSDCGAVGDVYSSGSHDWAPPGWTTSTSGGTTTWTNNTTGQQVSGAAGGQAYAVRAGTQLNCTGAEYTLPNIEQAIKAGILSEGVIDNALVHLFTIRMETGEFDPPSQVPYTSITKDVIQSPAHQALAEKVASSDIVLLKNDNVQGTSAPLLPVDASKLSHVVIVGNLANTVTLGGYSGDPSLRVSAVRGITAAVQAANPGATVTFDACGTSTTATQPAACSAATQDAIKTADLVIVFVGTDESVASEGRDRTSLAMPGNYDSLISQVAAAGNPRTALVIQSDGPVDIAGVQGDFPAIVFSGYNGESQGAALADVLTGKQDPAGHLDFTWYKDDSQLPGMKNYGLTPSQTGGLGRTYEYFTGTPTYPFGYGLSYTHFAYSHITANRSVNANGNVAVGFDVTNTGTTAGATVAQVYAAPQFTVPGVELPAKQLVAFRKTAQLQPGQTEHITLIVKASQLSQWDETQLKQVVYDGSYQFEVATDASDSGVMGSGIVNVTGAIASHVQYVTVQPDRVVFKPGDTLDLTGKNPWIADDTNPSMEQPHATADNIVEAVNNDQSFVNLSHADVSYASSNPNVATVGPTGKVTAVAHGAAAISVTVNGVTGTTPIVVQQPFNLTAPPVVTPGTTATVTTALPNSGSQPLKNVSVALTAPSGWTATATSPSTFATVQPGQTAQTTWSVAVPAGAAPGSYQLTASADFTDANGPGTVTAPAQTSVPFASLPDAFDNPGISDDANPSAGNLDGGGFSYSAQALAAAGLTPAAKITHDGATFTWSNAQPGTPDNVVAGGQTIALSGSGTTLGLLGAGDYGAASGTGTIIYTDGSTQQFTLTFPDWWSNTVPPGGDILATVPYINTPTGRLNQRVSVYYAAVPLQPGKTVKYLTLPDVSQGVSQGETAMHIFAAGFACCSLTVKAPGTVTPGQPASVQTVLTNASDGTATNAAVSLTAPAGWTVTPGGPATAGSLGSGQSLTTNWSVAVPSSAPCGIYRLHVTATLTTPSGDSVSLPQDASVGIVCASMAAALNNVGITSDSNTAPGNLDGQGDSYSAEGLASDGITPGATVSVGAVKLTWPNVPAGQPDNVVAEGQTINLSGSGSTLVFLGAADFGSATGTGTVTYTDGSTQSFSLSLADWYSNAPQAGGTLVATTHWNTPSGPGAHLVGIYSASVPLEQGKTVQSVTLPAVSSGVAQGVTAMHIFAIGIG
ncbi:MAG: glycoside hydrolase family 3 C-terminal domain-containing protein [Micromonosporaceae bacterium]